MRNLTKNELYEIELTGRMYAEDMGATWGELDKLSEEIVFGSGFNDEGIFRTLESLNPGMSAEEIGELTDFEEARLAYMRGWNEVCEDID